jgi:hypothetical protein
MAGIATIPGDAAVSRLLPAGRLGHDVAKPLCGIGDAHGQGDGDHPALVAVGLPDRNRGPQPHRLGTVAVAKEHVSQSLGHGGEQKVVDRAPEAV